MDAQIFWNIIGNYNEQTIIVQIIFLIFAIVISYVQRIKWLAKFALGIANLYIAIFFFALYGTEPVQKYFALPLFLLCGLLFLYESWHKQDDVLRKPDLVQGILLALYFLYPFVSLLLGNSFPQMVTYIMPCPVASLSIAVYAGYQKAGYQKKNKLLLDLLTIWGLTGIKSLIFNAYEDIVLLVCGLYGVVLLFKEIREHRQRSR